MLGCVDVHLALEQDPHEKFWITLAVAANDFTAPVRLSYPGGDRSDLAEFARDVLSFEVADEQYDIKLPGLLYNNLLFRGEAWDWLLATRRELAGRARIRFLLTGEAHLVDQMWEVAPIPSLSGGSVPLGLDDTVSLIRVTGGPTRRTPGVTTSRVLVATATDLSGQLRLPGGEEIELADSSGRGPRDADIIRAALAKIDYQVDAQAQVTRRGLSAKLTARHHAVVFCGHHITVPRPGLVVHPDGEDDEEATADLLDDNLLEALLGSVPPALAVLVACDSGGPVGSYGSLARRLAVAGVPLVVGVYGSIQHHDAEGFVATFFEELSRGSPADAAVAKAIPRFLDRYVLPVVYAHELPDLRHEKPAPKRPAESTLRAWAWPAGWSPRTAMPFDENRQERLDLLGVLDRGPLTVVLADERAPSLADSLNAVEEVLRREAAQQGHQLIPRAWYEYDASNDVPETLDDWLRLAGHPAPVKTLLADHPGGASLGLVVRARVPRPPWPYGGDWARLIGEFAEFRESELRDAALILRVTADHPVDAVLGAADIAGRISRHEPVLLCRVTTPWTGPAPILRGRGADAFRTAIDEARRLRGLADGPPPTTGGVSVSVTQAAEALVTEPPERFDDEVALLLGARDWLSGCYLPMLTAYARRRDGPGRYAALVAASGVAAHLDHWLTEAISAGRPPRPGEAPLAALRSGVVDSLLWALRRHGHRELMEAWLELREGEPVHRLIEVTRTGAARFDWAAEDPAAVRRWTREVKLTSAGLSDADPGRPGWWAALSQMPLKPELAARLLALPHPLPLVAGLHDRGGRTGLDVTDADLVAVLRRAYQPTRHERA